MFIMTGSRGVRGRNSLPARLAGLLKTTPITGATEYDGKALYFTPQSTQRGLIEAPQLLRLNTAFAGSNATGAQTMFNKGVTLSANTVYAFEMEVNWTKSVGTTSHNLSIIFAGTATLNNISYRVHVPPTAVAPNNYSPIHGSRTNGTTFGLVNGIVTASVNIPLSIVGSVSISAGGTFIPQYSLSAAPGGAYSTDIGSMMKIYPIGAAGADTSIGTWA